MRVLVLCLAFALALGCNPDRDGPTMDGPPPKCGTTACNSSTEFCYEVSVGRADGLRSAAVTTGCNAAPTECGSVPTCACVTPNETFSCPQTPGCSVMDGVVTVVCGEP
jgi:hypothetical protein